MKFCYECHGLGKTFSKDNSVNKGDSIKVCQVCEEFGLIRKQEGGFQERDGHWFVISSHKLYVGE